MDVSSSLPVEDKSNNNFDDYNDSTWFLHQFVATSPIRVSPHDLDNFGFENPNFDCERNHPALFGYESESLNSIDTYLGANDTVEVEKGTFTDQNSSKKGRRRYAQLGTQDMGVPPTSPTGNERFVSGQFNEQFSQATNLNKETNSSTDYYYLDADTIDQESSSTETNSTMSVDYTHRDFRDSFAAIDQAARAGNLTPGSGVRVRREGDTTVMTEHRDPYSFYWQLDRARKHQEPPPPPREPITQIDNVIEEIVTDNAQVQSPDSHDSGIQVEYSKPQRDESPRPKRILPSGWEKHEDPTGYSYYWHVDSGTIQRDAPPMIEADDSPQYQPSTLSTASSTATTMDRATMAAAPPEQVIVEKVVEIPKVIALPPQQPVIEERAFKQTTTKRRVEKDVSDEQEGMESALMNEPIRFAVRSLGWTEISEEELTPERSSRAVNRAIVDLSTGRNDLIDNVAKWGDGKELIMELDDHDLRLIDPDSGTVLHTQPIHQIRVWGVGRDNGRDFAYVARDRNSRRFMCHVFRCDTPARTIANTLRDICKRLMLERRPNSLQTDQHRPGSAMSDGRVGTSERRRVLSRESSFPTPMEEPKKIIRCHFLGVTQVPRATGIDILNEAVDRLVAQVKAERWILVDVSIAPSTIVITEVGGNQITECRVRYLSFLGIGSDIKHCAFIMHTSSENFMCYVFHVEPSAGAMAKTIEAACKLRYQKVLDAHGPVTNTNNGKGWGDTIRDVFGSLTGRISSNNGHHRPSSQQRHYIR